MAEFVTKGWGALNTVLGSIGTAGATGILGNLFGNATNCNGENSVVNRYEVKMLQELAAKDSKISLLESNIYVDGKIADVYERLNNKISGLETQICHQSVINAQVGANLSCMQTAISALQGLTKTIIPIGNICPPPMPEFNSWTAPTTTPTT